MPGARTARARWLADIGTTPPIAMRATPTMATGPYLREGWGMLDGHLGERQGSSDISFGREGMPIYIQGPRDNTFGILTTLRRTVGDGNFHYFCQLPDLDRRDGDVSG
jgi:hypothetical protein